MAILIKRSVGGGHFSFATSDVSSHCLAVHAQKVSPLSPGFYSLSCGFSGLLVLFGCPLSKSLP